MKKRIYHKLRENKRTSTPYTYIFIDVETRGRVSTRGEIHKAYLWCGCYVRILFERGGKIIEEWKVAQNGDEFWGWVWSKATKNKVIRLCGHKISYDLLAGGFFKYLFDHNGRIDKIYQGDGTFSMIARLGEKKIQILDTLNFFPATVEEIGEMVGKEKLKVDYEKTELPKMIEYCKRDVEIIKDAMLRLVFLIRNEDWGKMGITLAGIAWNLFRHKFYKKNIYIHASDEILKLERDAIYGGRCECFRLGVYNNGTFYKLDVNSLYPFVARDLEVPTRLVGYYTDISVKKLKEVLKNYAVIAEVFVETQHLLLPKRKQGQVFYARGSFKTVLADPELRLAIEHNVVKKVHYAAVYEKAPIFTEFVDFVIAKKEEARREGRILEANIYKLIANALIGKFAQRDTIFQKLGEMEEEKYEKIIEFDADTRERSILLHFGKDLFRSERGGEVMNSFPAISACVFSAARVRMLELINKANKLNVYYMDTDSLIVNEDGYRRLKDEIDQVQLGKLKLEKIARRLIIYGKKDYILDDEVKVKGVRKTARQISENEFEDIRIPSLVEHITEGILDEVHIRRTRIRLQREYKTGKVQRNGMVFPLLFFEKYEE